MCSASSSVTPCGNVTAFNGPRSSAGIGSRSASARPSTTTSPSPTDVFGSTRSIRRPATTRPVRVRLRDNVAVLRVVLKVKDGAGGEAYRWVECSACDTAWQVPHYSAQSVG